MSRVALSASLFPSHLFSIRPSAQDAELKAKDGGGCHGLSGKEGDEGRNGYVDGTGWGGRTVVFDQRRVHGQGCGEENG